ncbi:MAG: tetratricopeptide repeat protein [Terracidiphilus sp.]
MFHKPLLACALLILVLSGAPVRAHAASKEIIQLQTQVQQLLDMVQRLQTTMDTRFAVLQNLAQQTADQATQMNGTVNTLQQKLNAQNESLSGKLDGTSGQIQSLNDSVDELKTRIGKLEQSIQTLQNQLQNVQSAPPAGAPPAGAGAGDGGAQQGPGGVPNGPGGGAGGGAAMNSTPPLQQTYQAALTDFNAGKYPLATSEFQDVIKYYPMDPFAGSAQFYLGEISYRQHNYDEAVRSYNIVLEQFSGSSKAPAAQLHKGMSLIDLNKRESGVHELRSLIQRYPQTPEAAQARAKLNGMGVRINASAR